MNAKYELKSRRSPCPVSCVLDIVGDRWTLLIVRDLLLGKARFKDFQAAPEKIPTNLLSDRLERLQAAQIVEQYHAPEGGKHLAYRLTPRGEELRPIVLAMREWGLKWQKGTRASRAA